MPGNFKKDDLRIEKTRSGLLSTLPKLLQRHKIRQLTVNDICGEAKLSRTAFYAHFTDKYDLLKYWFTDLKGKLAQQVPDGVNAVFLNRIVNENKRVLRNLFEDGDDGMFELYNEFLPSLMNITPQRDKNGKLTLEYIVLSGFCAGGIINHITWRIKNNFSQDTDKMTAYLLKILEILAEGEK